MLLEQAYSGHCLSCGAPCYAQSHCDKCAIAQDEEEVKENENRRWTGITKKGSCRQER